MAKKKQPYIPLYTGDYIKDTRTLSLEAKGAWSDLILFMWVNESGGVLEGNMEEFARMVGTTELKFVAVLNELCRKKVCDIEGDTSKFFKIICRRLKREAEISAIRSDAVQNRYKTPTNTNTKDSTNTVQKSDNDIDNDNDNGFVTEFKEKESSEKKITISVPRESNEHMTEEWFAEIFDSAYMGSLTMPFRGLNLQQELSDFKVKVRGAPGEYKRDSGGIRNAFLYQLRQAREKKTGKPVKVVSQDRMNEFKNMRKS